MKKLLFIIIYLLISTVCLADSGRILDDDDDPYYIQTIYDGNDLMGIQYAQSNDVMYLTHPNYPPQKLTRYDHANWTIEEVEWEDGPFIEANTDRGFTITPSRSGNDDGYDEYKYNDDSQTSTYGSRWHTQTFKATDSYTAVGVKIKLLRTGLPGTVTVSIRATTDGKPSGDDLATGTRSGNTLPQYLDPYILVGWVPSESLSSGKWREVTFAASTELTSDTTYAIVVRATGGDSGNIIHWRHDASSPSYTTGSLGSSSNSGTDWTMNTASDLMFEIVGESLNSSETTLRSSAALFNDDHVGSLWQISHLVAASAITHNFWENNYPDGTETSNTIKVMEGQEYDVMTSGDWTGTFKIQRSYDNGGTWEDVYSVKYRGDGNIQYSSREDEETCLYRMRMVGQYVTSHNVRNDEGMCTGTFNTRTFVYHGNVEITAVADANTATALIIKVLYSSDATWRWAEGAWSDYRGYPRAVCFYQNRLCLAGTAYQPAMLWCSQSGDYENMDLGEGLDNEAIAREIGAAGQNPIMWIKDKRGIIAGTTGSIIRIGTPSSKYVFTPSMITSERSVETGACNIQPGLTKSSIVYVDRNRRKVRDLSYDVSSDDLVSPDLTIFSDDITEPNIVEMAWQKRPDEMGWFVKDSNMVTLTYNPERGVSAWTEIATDGNYVSVCVIPGADEDEVWVAVERDCNDYIMIEKFHKQNWKDDVWFVDSGLEYSGDATETLTGLGHLEGKSVQVYSDANGYIGDFTVSGGSITLNSSETQAIAGLGYTATIKTLPIEVSAQLGPSVGMTKNIRLITLCLYESEGGRYGYETMYDILYPSYSTDFYSGLTRLGMDTGYQMDVHLIIDQNEPLPLGITGIAINKYELSTDF